MTTASQTSRGEARSAFQQDLADCGAGDRYLTEIVAPEGHSLSPTTGCRSSLRLEQVTSDSSVSYRRLAVTLTSAILWRLVHYFDRSKRTGLAVRAGTPVRWYRDIRGSFPAVHPRSSEHLHYNLCKSQFAEARLQRLPNRRALPSARSSCSQTAEMMRWLPAGPRSRECVLQ